MRLGLWSLAALFLGAFGAHFLLEDRGYVLVSFRSYVVEMSVPALVLTLALGYVLVRILIRAWRVPRSLGQAVADRRVKRSSSRLTQGLIHMSEGDFSRGERLLTQGLSGTDTPLVNYLLAARAAQAQGSLERRNEWLAAALEALPEARAAILLTQAELQLEAAEPEHALATLSTLLEARSDHPAALALLARTYRALGDHTHVLELLPRLGAARLPEDELVRLAADALEAAIADDSLDLKQLDSHWLAAPAVVRRAPSGLAAYALALQQLGQGARAEKQLRQALKRDWQPALVDAYGRVEGEDVARQLKQAEQWLRQHPEDARLLQTTARLCMTNALWGKARSYLESSLAIAPDPGAYALYGQLLDRLGENERAALAYHSGLSLVSGVDLSRPALDAPRPDDEALDAS